MKLDFFIPPLTVAWGGGRSPTLLCAAVLCGISARRRVQSMGARGAGGEEGRARETEVGQSSA
jgi:hypothetical protein